MMASEMMSPPVTHRQEVQVVPPAGAGEAAEAGAVVEDAQNVLPRRQRPIRHPRGRAP